MKKCTQNPCDCDNPCEQILIQPTPDTVLTDEGIKTYCKTQGWEFCAEVLSSGYENNGCHKCRLIQQDAHTRRACEQEYEQEIQAGSIRRNALEIEINELQDKRRACAKEEADFRNDIADKLEQFRCDSTLYERPKLGMGKEWQLIGIIAALRAVERGGEC